MLKILMTFIVFTTILIMLPAISLTWAQTSFDGQLYNAEVEGNITDVDGNADNFENDDVLDLTLRSVSSGKILSFFGTRPEFDQFVEENLDAIFDILFPSSVSEGVTGKESSQEHSQQSFINRVLTPRLRRSEIGGFFNFEFLTMDQFDDKSNSGQALSGIFYIDPLRLALEGRFAILGDAKSYALGLEFYPTFRLQSDPVEWFVGGSLFGTPRLITWDKPDSTFDKFGDLDLGGSLSTSVQKDFAHLRLVGGLAFQASKTYVPTRFLPEDIKFIADVLNQRPADFQLLSGGGIAIALGRASLNAKGLYTFMLDNAEDSYTTLITGISYLFSGIVPIDIGYKGTFGIEGFNAHSIFILGNYRF